MQCTEINRYNSLCQFLLSQRLEEVRTSILYVKAPDRTSSQLFFCVFFYDFLYVGNEHFDSAFGVLRLFRDHEAFFLESSAKRRTSDTKQTYGRLQCSDPSCHVSPHISGIADAQTIRHSRCRWCGAANGSGTLKSLTEFLVLARSGTPKRS